MSANWKSKPYNIDESGVLTAEMLEEVYAKMLKANVSDNLIIYTSTWMREYLCQIETPHEKRLKKTKLGKELF
jgi:hypothetical protein